MPCGDLSRDLKLVCVRIKQTAASRSSTSCDASKTFRPATAGGPALIVAASPTSLPPDGRAHGATVV